MWSEAPWEAETIAVRGAGAVDACLTMLAGQESDQGASQGGRRSCSRLSYRGYSPVDHVQREVATVTTATPYFPRPAGRVAAGAPPRCRSRLMTGPARHPCAACGHCVHLRPAGSGATCPICGWLDDYEQLVHPDMTYGANAGLSLRQAQARTRSLRPGEGQRGEAFERDADWRPLRDGEMPAADRHAPSSPVCYIATPDPADYVPYWRRGRRS